ncbi:MAG: hypothetical protein HY554_18710 [Elusimicrobia bacterium]|nr:hypothetical protein [Elusimicrobiota bacterium]
MRNPKSAALMLLALTLWAGRQAPRLAGALTGLELAQLAVDRVHAAAGSVAELFP